jgi:hypothetical protein
MGKVEDLRLETRRKILAELATKFAQDLHALSAYEASREWPGFESAYASWEAAVWLWVAMDVDASIENKWRKTLLEKRGSFSATSDYSKPAEVADIEHYLQSYLLRRCYFLSGLRHKRSADPDWFKSFGFYFYLAQQLGDDKIFSELARLTTRKKSQDAGKRQLQFWLLLFWVPGCFWALSTDGMVARLQWKDGELKYSSGTVRNVILRLRLWRPTKPLYWGLNNHDELTPLR